MGLIDQIAAAEGYSASPAWDYKQSSSGYGTKAQPGDENIPPDQLQAVHEQRLRDEVAKAEAHVDSVNPNLPAGARAALVSLTYNAGPGWSQSGLGDLIRAGDLEGAKERFLQYNKAGGEVNPGLVARRTREAGWFGPPLQRPSVSPASPATGIPAQAAPIFAAPQTEPEQPAPSSEPQSLFAQMQAPGQPPPIFFAPRRSPDLSKLKSAMASGNRGLFLGRG